MDMSLFNSKRFNWLISTLSTNKLSSPQWLLEFLKSNLLHLFQTLSNAMSRKEILWFSLFYPLLFATDLFRGCKINKLSPTQFAINIKLSLFNQFKHDCGLEKLQILLTHENRIVPFVPHCNLFSFLIHTGPNKQPVN